MLWLRRARLTSRSDVNWRRCTSASASSRVSRSFCSCSSSVSRQKIITPTQATSTARPCTTDHSQGFAWAAGWLNISVRSHIEPTPWLTTVNSTLNRNGTQSWYSAMKPMMMKKWKWASMVPPVRPTSTVEHHTSPAVTATDAVRRRVRVSHPTTTHATAIASAMVVGTAGRCSHTARAARAGTCAASTPRRSRCRRCQSASVRAFPRGRTSSRDFHIVSRTVLSAVTWQATRSLDDEGRAGRGGTSGSLTQGSSDRALADSTCATPCLPRRGRRQGAQTAPVAEARRAEESTDDAGACPLRVRASVERRARDRPADPTRARVPARRWRAQPDPDDEAATRHSRDARRHQRGGRADRHPGGGRAPARRRDGAARRAARLRRRRGAVPDPPRRRADDRRPAGAQPRHGGWLAVPGGPVGGPVGGVHGAPGRRRDPGRRRPSRGAGARVPPRALRDSARRGRDPRRDPPADPAGRGDTVTEVGIGLAALGAAHFDAPEAEVFLRGRPATEATFLEAGRIVAEHCRPPTDQRGPADYKRHLACELTVRALT